MGICSRAEEARIKRQGRSGRAEGRTYAIVIAVVVFGGDQGKQTVECLRMAAQPFLIQVNFDCR